MLDFHLCDVQLLGPLHLLGSLVLIWGPALGTAVQEWLMGKGCSSCLQAKGTRGPKATSLLE